MSEPKRERNNDSYEVAIIGMSGRFPGAKDVPSLWEVLRQGKETIRHFSDEELIAAGVDPSSLLDKAYVKANGVLDGVDLFDATFFDMSPREAKITDPQHRLFLECAYEALEDAGHPVGEGEASVGVYAGVGFCTYLLFQLSDCITANELAMYQTVIGNDKDYLPTRVSYMLDLKGPSLAVQTACSSSLVAVHSACQSLLAGECDLALAGGVSVVFPHNEGYHYQQNGILSPDGHCRAFDVNSQGMVSGNGVGIVTLKRLEDAIANGDRIRAVIKGSAINNDGHQKVGYTAPLSTAQSAVIHEALTLSGVHPRDIDYIEAHGTGTALGDPIEIEALNRAFRLKRSEAQCLLGSIKTNIGHLDTASGVAGLIKTVLAMENEELPASLHFSEPNPQIDFEGGPFLVNTELRPWPRRHDRPRHAGVSSFGIGGTNAHVVLGEAPTPAPSGSSRRWQVLPLSAKTSEALNQMMDNMAVCLEEPNKNEALADTASSLAYGRKAYRHRYSVVAKNNVEAAEMLRSSERVCVVAGDTQDVTFLFPGQGTQRLGMGADLYQREAIFRREFDKCAQILGDELDFDLHIVLFASGEEAEERLRQTDVAQPALFVVSYALARQWMSWGVKPSAMLGHSLGEYVAACLAGVMQLKEALRLVVARGRLIKELPGGAMLAVPLAENEVQGYLNANLDLAAVNSARMCVISGPYEEIDNLKERLGDEGLVVQVLRTSHAFHSAMMEPALEAFRTEVEKVNLSAPTLPYISNLTGSWVTADQVMDPEYWVRHLRSPVRFAAGIDCLIEQGETVFLEIGPGRSLSQLTRKQIGAQAHVITSLPYDEKDGMEDKELSSAVGALWCAGSALDWKAYYDGEQRRRVGLPSYPFEQQKHFVYPGRTITRAADPSHWFYTPSWRRRPATEAGVTPEEIYLVFTDELGAGNELAVHLRKQGRRVVTVSIGSGFSVSEAGVDYLVGPSAMDYEKLVTELSDHSLIPQTVVHLWGLNVLQGNKVTERYKEAQRNGLHSLLWLVQTLEKAPKAISQLLVAVDGLFDVIGGETLYPEKATVMGVCRVLPQEHSGLLCRVADLSGKESPERLAEQLLAELTTKRKDEPVIAWRGAYRWVQGFEQTKLPAPEGRIKSLRQGGVYLITGGLGGVGLVLARALARNCQARLVLTTRSPFPPRSEWQQWLDVHPDKDQTSSTLDLDFRSMVKVLQYDEKALRETIRLPPFEEYEKFNNILDCICTWHILDCLVSNGINTGVGERYSKSVIKQHLSLDPRMFKFFDFLLNVLLEDGIVQITDDVLIFKKNIGDVDIDTLYDEAMKRLPQCAGTLRLMKHCTANYQKVLSNASEALVVLYPDGTPAMLDQIEKDTADYTRTIIYEKLAHHLVLHICDKRKKGSLRILEIGAGEGHLSWALAEQLKEHQVSYYFTDIGSSFVISGQKKAQKKGLDFMKFSVLDISQDCSAQGLEIGSFDIILGLNVVHATANIETALGNLNQLLVPGGILAMVEALDLPRWFTMTRGMVEGWWFYNDKYRHGGLSPLMPISKWQEVINKCGFDVTTFPSIDMPVSFTDHGLIVARKPLFRLREDGESDSFKKNKPKENDQATDASIREQIAAIIALEELGSNVVISQADVTDKKQMGQVIKDVRTRFGDLNGIIHAAGVLKDKVAVTLDDTTLELVMGPKIQGALVLDELTKDIRLDFFLLCSSLGSIIPSPGQTAYTAANNFFDCFANSGLASNPVISVNWPVWHETGMARLSAIDGRYGFFKQTCEGLEIDQNEGEDCLIRLLSTRKLASQTFVSPIEIQLAVTLTEELRLLAFDTFNDEQKITNVDNASKEEQPSSRGEPSNAIEKVLYKIWCDVLGYEDFNIDDNFFRLGGDSLLAIQIVNRATKNGYQLGVKDFFNNQSIRELASSVMQKQGM